MAYNKGNTLFTGDYASPNVPLWLSASNPTTSPANITVSSITVAPQGGVIVTNDGLPRPSTLFGSVIFDRLPDRSDVYLKQNISKNVPTFPDDREYLSVTAATGQIYDDLAVAGLQIFGFQLTNPLANTGCAGRLTQGSLPYSVRLDTGVFQTNDITASIGNFSSINVSTITAPGGTVYSTLTVSSLQIDNLTASTLIVSSILAPGTTVYSTLTVSSLQANNLTASTLNVSSFSIPANSQVSTITALQGTFSSLIATDGKISSLNVSSISSFNTNTSNLNAGFTKTFFASTNSEAVNSSYISSLLANSIIAVTTQATDMNASVVRSGNIYGTNNASFVSTGNLIAPNTYTTSISTNNINASTFNTTIANVNLGNFSTVIGSNYSTISTVGVVAGYVSSPQVIAGNVSTNTVAANVATFSTLNAPAGSVTVSTVNTGLVSTTIANVKEMFVSTMQFNASLSPNFNLDMGGIVGGLIGYAGANTLSMGLGAVNLATGIAGLAMSRQSGGINSNVFQTVNGTAQLQYSTLGTPTQTTFVTTDSANPEHVQGNIVYTSTFISSGTYCMRTISDPLNLANGVGQTGQGIQGYSEWTPVYPGFFSITQNINNQTQLYDSASQNLINFGGGGGPRSTLTVFSPNRMNIASSNELNLTIGSTLFLRASTINIFREPDLFGTVSTTNINVIGSMNLTSTLQSKVLNVSTISGGTFPIQIIPGLNTSTLAVSSLTIGTSVQTNFQTSTLTVTGNAQFQQGVSFSSNTTISLANLSTASTTVLSYSGGGGGVIIGNNPPISVGGNDLVVTGQVFAGGTVTASSAGIGTSLLDGANLILNNGNTTFTGNGTGGLLISTLLGGTPNVFVDVGGNLFSKRINSRGTNLTDGWMSPNPPTSSTYGTQWGSMILSGLLIQWGIANPGSPPTYYAPWTFIYPYKTATVPVVLFTTITYSGVPSYASLVSVTNTGYTALAAQGPGAPFNTQLQWISIGPAP